MYNNYGALNSNKVISLRLSGGTKVIFVNCNIKDEGDTFSLWNDAYGKIIKDNSYKGANKKLYLFE